MRQVIVNLAEGLLGVNYLWGGDSPSRGFDCSGLVLWIFQALRLLPKRDMTSDTLYGELLRAGKISPAIEKGQVPDSKPGDLAFYGSPEKIIHVAIVTGPNAAISASGGGMAVTSREKAIASGAEVKRHRINYRGDFLAIGSIDGILSPSADRISAGLA